jgi:[ribosomal protein S5]-alanine N-acetyltransferase
MVTLKTERLTLRSYTEEDATRIAEIANNKNIARNMVSTFPHPYTLDDANTWIGLANSPEKKGLVFAIEFEGELIGGTGFDLKDGDHEGVASGGYWLGEDYWGKGIATEAWCKIRDYAFEKFDIRRLEAGVYSWNLASAKVQKKAGFTKEGCLRKSVIKFGEVGDEIRYGLTREDWEKLKGKSDES